MNEMLKTTSKEFLLYKFKDPNWDKVDNSWVSVEENFLPDKMDVEMTVVRGVNCNMMLIRAITSLYCY